MPSARWSPQEIIDHCRRTGKPIPKELLTPPTALALSINPDFVNTEVIDKPVDNVKERVRREPNFTEQLYANRYLEDRKRKGEIRDYIYEGYRLKLADGSWYKPDWVVINWDGSLEIIEVKGAAVWDRDIVRFKVACGQYPWHTFIWAQKKGKGRDAEFIIQRWAASSGKEQTEE